MNYLFASRRLLHKPALCSVSSGVPWLCGAQVSLPFVATINSSQSVSRCDANLTIQGSNFFRRRVDCCCRVPISRGSYSLSMPFCWRAIWIDLLEDCSGSNERLRCFSLDRRVPVVFSPFLRGLAIRQLPLFFTIVCGKSTWHWVCKSRHQSFFAGSCLQSGMLYFSADLPFVLQSSFIMGQAFSVAKPFAVMEKGENLHSTCGDESDNFENKKDMGGGKQKRDASEAEHVNDGTEHSAKEDDEKIETLNNNLGLGKLQIDASLGEHERARVFNAKVDAEVMKEGEGEGGLQLEEESAQKVARQVQEKAKAVEDELGPPPERPLPGDCCGQGCDVCVWDTYNDQLQKYNALKKALQDPK